MHMDGCGRGQLILLPLLLVWRLRLLLQLLLVLIIRQPIWHDVKHLRVHLPMAADKEGLAVSFCVLLSR